MCILNNFVEQQSCAIKLLEFVACRLFVLTGDLAAVGSCMSDYWQLKKRMAPGCEPELVTRIMKAMEPHVLGMSLAGAGGGGFMYLLTKKPGSVELVRNVLTGVQVDDTTYQRL